MLRRRLPIHDCRNRNAPGDRSGAGDPRRVETRFGTSPMYVAEDGTRRYRIDAEGADIDAFDPKLNEVDPGWRDHLTNWRDD
jgi:hypothetical protein